MLRKRPKHRVRATILSHRRLHVLVKPRNRTPDRVRRAPRAVNGPPPLLALEFDNFLKLAQGFGLFGLGRVGVEDRLKFFLLLENGAHGFGLYMERERI